MRRLAIFILSTAIIAPLAAAGKKPAAVLLARVRALDDSHYSIKKLKYLRQGRYRCVVSGVLCNSCTRGIVAELKKIRGVEDAVFDFEEGLLWITIKKREKVRGRRVRQAMHHASRRVNLGSHYRITDIRFEP